jgi:hypothetical protein
MPCLGSGRFLLACHVGDTEFNSSPVDQAVLKQDSHCGAVFPCITLPKLHIHLFVYLFIYLLVYSSPTLYNTSK